MNADTFEALVAPLRRSRPAGLVCMGRAMRVHAASEAVIEFLRATFYPAGAFHVHGEEGAEPAEGGAALVFYDRTAAVDELARVGEAASRAALRTGSYSPVSGVSFARYDVGGVEVFMDGPLDAPGGVVVRRGNEILLLSRDDREHPRRATRVLRQVVGRILEDHRHLPFHASSFQMGGRAYLVVGDAGAGKSTLSVAVARFVEGASWIGNDRAYVDLAGDALHTTACPLPLAVNKGSLAALEVEGYQEWPLLEPRPDESTDWAEYDGDAKMKLSPLEVERYLRAQVCAGAPLGGIVFPSVRLDGQPPLCRRTSLAEHVEVLRRNCLALRDNLYPEDWLGVRGAVPDGEAAFAEFLARTASIPAWVVRTSAYRDTRTVTALLAADARAVAA